MTLARIMKNGSFNNRVERVRAFSRFYTRKAGVLNEMLLDSNFALTEARVMYELNNRRSSSARELASDLDLDPAYLSRLLKKFEKQDYISRKTSETDRRSQIILLTKKGQQEADILNERSMTLFGNLIEPLDPSEQEELISAMDAIEDLLSPSDDQKSPFILRPHRPGDMGWIIEAHGRLYAHEYGWDNSFEALVAEIASDFLKNFDAACECCWIAERNGRNVGSAVIVREDHETAKLRLVIVDPAARGYGIGLRLVEECMNSARRFGYSQMSLWTNKNLTAAINIYKKLEFTLIEEEPHHSFGKDLVGQYWKRAL